MHVLYFVGVFDSNMRCMPVDVHSFNSRRHVLPYVSSISLPNLCNFNVIKHQLRRYTSTRILQVICDDEIGRL